MKVFYAAALAVSLSVVPAKAQTVDLSSVTCKEFLTLDKDSITAVAMWLAGYYSASDAAAVIDFGKIANELKQLGAKCREKPSSILTSVAEPIMGEK